MILSSSKKAPSEITVIPVHDGGILHDAHGTDLVVNRAGAERVIEEFKRRGIRIVIDYEHQTEMDHARPDGKAPAAGWIDDLRWEEGKGVVASTTWTDEARRMIDNSEYAYFSPVIVYHAETKELYRLKSVGLTNSPAIIGAPRIAASLRKEKDMDGILVKLVKAYQEDGVAAVATPEQKVGELKALLESMGTELGDQADFVAIINAAIAKIKGGGEEEEGNH